MNKRLAGTGLAIGLVAGAGAGLVLELSGSVGASSGQAVTAAAATDDTTPDTSAPDTSSSTDTAKPDRSTRLQEILQPLIDDHTLTQAQVDKVIAALEAARPVGGPMGGRHIMGPGFGLDVIANTLGITADEVRTALQDGQSIADLAVSKGKTGQDVIDAIVAETTTRINERVTAGDLTQDQADKIIADVTTRATEFVNNTPSLDGPWTGGPGGPWMGGRGFGGPGHHHDVPGDADGDDTPADAPADTTPTTVVG